MTELTNQGHLAKERRSRQKERSRAPVLTQTEQRELRIEIENVLLKRMRRLKDRLPLADGEEQPPEGRLFHPGDHWLWHQAHVYNDPQMECFNEWRDEGVHELIADYLREVASEAEVESWSCNGDVDLSIDEVEERLALLQQWKPPQDRRWRAVVGEPNGVDGAAARLDIDRAEVILYPYEDRNERYFPNNVWWAFARILAMSTYGSTAQGVEPHGSEFVGVYCYLLAERHHIGVRELLKDAVVEGNLRVLPFEPNDAQAKAVRRAVAKAATPSLR